MGIGWAKGKLLFINFSTQTFTANSYPIRKTGQLAKSIRSKVFQGVKGKPGRAREGPNYPDKNPLLS
jgi:hypothetical protein